MLRSTWPLARASGGADTVLVLPFDVAIPGGFPGTARSLRAASPETPSCCCWKNPCWSGVGSAAGSWFVEDLTKELTQQAWQHFQAIEARADSSKPAPTLPTRSAKYPPSRRRHRAPAHRGHRRQRVSEPRRTRLCPNRFVDSGGCRRESCSAMPPGSKRCAIARMFFWREPVHARRRYCCRWGRWPSTTSGPRSPRTCSPPAESRRSTPEPLMPTASPRPSLRFPTRGRRGVAVLCATDTRYGTEAAGVVEAARRAGVSRIYLAGPEKA